MVECARVSLEVRKLTEGLHPRRARILRFLAHAARRGESPTEREVGKAVGLKSSQTAHYHLRRLEEDGYIERGVTRSRNHRPVRLTQRGWEAVGTVPMLGRIAAGRGMEAVATEEAYSLAAEMLSSRSGKWRFLLEARGESMVGAGIEEGDLLVVEENTSPPDGSVVAALLLDREETTVKVLYREGEKVRLEPRNGAHEDIVIPAERVVVQGTVEWVIRRVRGRR
jgi:repressor LexA